MREAESGSKLPHSQNTTSCEKYGDWMRDAALGALAPRRERELLAHVGECDACRDAYEHARELVALVDHGVESLVAGEPSPHFDARLRARIAEELPAQRLAWLTLEPLAGALVVALALAVAVVLWMPWHPYPALQTTRPRVDTASNARPQIPEKSLKTEGSSTNQRQVRARDELPGHRESSVARLVSRQSHAARQLRSPAEPEVLVPAGQLEAVMQFAAEIRSGRIDGKQLIAAQKDMDKPLRIQPLEIKSIETTPPTSNPDLPPAQSAVDSALH
ncbi:MAG TPA: hypothetical protein VKS44_01290 [Candidatus Acidoferrales bacterium]|nr:hypothetical protein [Candidatus Acidoferrales bacterium]